MWLKGEAAPNLDARTERGKDAGATAYKLGCCSPRAERSRKRALSRAARRRGSA